MKSTKKLCIVSIIAVIGVVAFGVFAGWFTAFNLSDQFHATPKIYSIELWQPHTERHEAIMGADEETKDRILALILQPTYYKVNQSGYLSDEENLALTIITLYIEANNVSDHYAYYVSNYGDLEIRDINRGKGAFYSLRTGKEAVKALYDELRELLDNEA